MTIISIMMMTEIRLEVVICSADHIDRIHDNGIIIMIMTEIRLEVVICSADHIDRVHDNNINNDDD